MLIALVLLSRIQLSRLLPGARDACILALDESVDWFYGWRFEWLQHAKLRRWKVWRHSMKVVLVVALEICELMTLLLRSLRSWDDVCPLKFNFLVCSRIQLTCWSMSRKMDAHWRRHTGWGETIHLCGQELRSSCLLMEAHGPNDSWQQPLWSHTNLAWKATIHCISLWAYWALVVKSVWIPKCWIPEFSSQLHIYSVMQHRPLP